MKERTLTIDNNTVIVRQYVRLSHNPLTLDMCYEGNAEISIDGNVVGKITLDKLPYRENKRRMDKTIHKLIDDSVDAKIKEHKEHILKLQQDRESFKALKQEVDNRGKNNGNGNKRETVSKKG